MSIHKIDLHMHSNISDGTDTPGEMLDKVKAAGIDLFSVTDHDAIKACVSIKEILRADCPLFLSGVEFSCRDSLGKYHILGYGYDSSAEAICSLVEEGHSSRIKKLGMRLQALREKFGIEFSNEDVAKLYTNNNPGKPHIANLLVKYGFAKTMKQAFSDFLNKAKIPNIYISPEKAISAILESGGIPVLAHPSFGSGDETIMGKEMEERLQRLMEFGIRGVEAYYSGFSPVMQKEILGLAEKYNLYITAGSDYHGGNKLVMLGDNNLADVDQAPAGLHRFLEDVSYR